MRLQRQHEASVSARTRRVALMLLALFLHAALAGAFHFHRLGRDLSAPTSHAAARNEATRGAPEAAKHAECLLCRLQRDLASGLSNARLTAAEPPGAPLPQGAAAQEARAGIFPGVARGRAPPNA